MFGRRSKSVAFAWGTQPLLASDAARFYDADPREKDIPIRSGVASTLVAVLFVLPAWWLRAGLILASEPAACDASSAVD